MSAHWQMIYDVGRGEIGRILFFILAPLGFFMFFFGKLLERSSPARLIVTGALSGFGSTMLLPFATSFAGVYLWAFVMGSATAMIYLSGLTVTQNWFPERRGLVSGVFNMCFGGSAALLSPVYSRLLIDLGYYTVTYGAAFCVLIFGLIPAAFIRFPKSRELSFAKGPAALPDNQPLSMTVGQSLHTRSFWLLWFIWAFAGAAGFSMVTLSTTFGVARGLTPHEAVALLTVFNITNGASRLISGYVSDFLGRKMTLSLSFFAAAAAYLFMDQTGSPILWMLLSAIIGYAFGTLFAVSAPLIGECFGMDHFGAIIGAIFTAYGFVAGIIGPWLGGHILDLSGGNFSATFGYLGSLYLSAGILTLLIRPQAECVIPVR